jgi:hypothetical protein
LPGKRFKNIAAGKRQTLGNAVSRIKKQALKALDVQIVATREKMKIRIAVPLECTTIEQTSA